MDRQILLLGGNGFIGYEVLKRISMETNKIKCVVRHLPYKSELFGNVEYFIGDINDREFLMEAMTNTDIVIDCISTSMPNKKNRFLSDEIKSTLLFQDYILSAMVSSDVKRYFFPSSGGAIYGNKNKKLAYEEDKLSPITPYGVGKALSEDIIKYYVDSYQIDATILRIGNAYGTTRLRDKAQGVVDVFIQNALMGKKIDIWGNAKQNVRDYVYLEDIANAFWDAIKSNNYGFNVYNVGTGVGTTIEQIITMIEGAIGRPFDVEHSPQMPSGVNSIILSVEKIEKEIGWQPKVEIADGIVRTVKKKQVLLKDSGIY